MSASLLPLSVNVMASALESKPGHGSSLVGSIMKVSNVLGTTTLQQLETNHGEEKKAPEKVTSYESGILGPSSTQLVTDMAAVGRSTAGKRKINIIVLGLGSSGKTTLISSIKGKTNFKCKPRYDPSNCIISVFLAPIYLQ